MKRMPIFLLLVLTLLTLSACKGEKPSDGQEPGPNDRSSVTQAEPEQLPAVQEDPPIQPDPDAPKPLTVEESSSGVMDMIAADFTLIANGLSLPDIAPKDEESIVELRAWMQKINDKETYFQFDTANLGMSDYGYQLNLLSPTDYWGSPVCFWLQDTSVGYQVVAAAAGADGVFTYKGFGLDYTTSGFGDDQVKLLDIQ